MNFYTSISKYYEDIFPFKKEKLEFVLDGVEQKENILDIGCSTGKLAKEINKCGHSIVGIDLDEEMISLAQRSENDGLHYHTMNMLRIDEKFYENEFDQILCFGNTIVHLESNKQVLDFLKKVKSLLKDGGKFKLQIINYDKILDKKLEGLPIIENDKIKFVRKYQVINELVEFATKLIVKNENKTIENKIMLLPIRKNEILNLLNDAGFNNVNCFSGFTRDELDENKLPLIIEAW